MPRPQTRSSGDGAIDPSLVQKKRARHRLVGAVSLCLVAAVVVPMVLESEPRNAARALPLEITPAPGSDAGPAGGPAGAGPLATAQSGTSGSGASASGAIVRAPGAEVTAPTAANPSGQAEARSTIRTITPPASSAASDAGAPTSSPAAAAPAAVAPAPPPTARATPPRSGTATAAQSTPPSPSSPPKPAAAPATASRPAGEPDVLARLIERADGAASKGGARVESRTEPRSDSRQDARSEADRAARRFLVQIGAYSNVQSARSVSDRVVQAGLRPYQETVKTAQGDWIRVRVGPFASRQDAERAQQDLKRAGVTAAIIAL